MNEPLNLQLCNREMYENGDRGGAWLKLPATAEQLNAALASIGAAGGGQGKDYFIAYSETPVHGLTRELVENATIDELNFLAAALQSRDDRQTAKLNAAIESMTGRYDIHRLTELTQNTDVYDFHPNIFNHIQLGEHTLEHSGLIQIPDEWAATIDVEMLGRLASEHEKGYFSEHGYIVPNGENWNPIREIPQEYRITATQKQEREQTPRGTDYDAIAARQPAVATAAPFVLVSDNPREKLKEITDKLEAGIKGIFDSEQYKAYLKTLSKFHNYSLNNTLLIALQKPDATHVAGFTAWRETFKRNVLKGEKGIKIIAPSPFKAKKEMDKIDPQSGRPVTGRDGKPIREEVEITVPSFKIATVFDVSQTEGEPLPEIGVDELTGSVDKYKEFFAALEKTAPFPVAFEKITSGAKGYCSYEEKRIAINEGMSELQNLKTAIHEITHARLHFVDKDLPKAEQPRADQHTREVEAESVAYTVCQHYGLDTSDYSFGYVATWSGGKELDVLKSSLETIRKEAGAIIAEIDGHLAEFEKSHEKEVMQGLAHEVKATLQMFVDEDLRAHGEPSADTLEAIAVQGYAYKDGKLELAAPERQPGYEKWSEPATAENAPDNPGVPSDDISAYLPGQAEQGDSFTIYQLKDGDETRDIRFEPLGKLLAAGLVVDPANYDKAYSAPLDNSMTLEKIYFAFNMDRPEDFTGHSLSMSDVIVLNKDGKETAFYVDSKGFQETPEFFMPAQERTQTQAQTAPPFDPAPVAGYLQKLHDSTMNADPNKTQGIAAYNMAVKRLNQVNERLPETQPQLKALVAHAAGSPDLPTLKERMATVQSEFTRHYNPLETAEKSTEQNYNHIDGILNNGANVAAIEAQAKAGQQINLSDLADAIKADKAAAQAAPGKTEPQNATAKKRRQTAKEKAAWSMGQSQKAWDYAQGKAAEPKKPSIHDDLKAGKEQIAKVKPTPQRAAAKSKNAGLGD
jgi:antirestriction protein ArdC